MGKLTIALLLTFLIELSLYLFAGVNYSQNSLFNLLINPVSLESSGFYAIFLSIFTISSVLIIAGTFFGANNQWVLFAGASAVLITFSTTYVDLWRLLFSQLSGIFNNSQMGGVIASLVTAPLLIFYLVTMVEWTRQN